MNASRTETPLPALGALGLLWAVVVLLIDPRGEFPVNDDWGYVPPVRTLVEEGALRFSFWQSMPLITHVLWGAAFGSVFGTSLTVLRLSTLFAGLLGLGAFHALLRDLRVDPRVALITAITLATSPVFLGTSVGFLSDVPFLAAALGSVWAWLRAEAAGSWRWRWLAIFLALWATLNRQVGLALPLAWVVLAGFRMLLARRLVLDREFWLETLIPALGIFATLFIYEKVIAATLGLPEIYRVKSHELVAGIRRLPSPEGVLALLDRVRLGLVNLSLFAAPLGVLFVGRRPLAALGGALLGLALSAGGLGAPGGVGGDILVDFGIGPRTALGDAAGAPPALWFALTAAAMAGLGATLAEAWSRRDERPPADDPRWVLVLTPLIFLGPVTLAVGPLFDRYSLPPLAFVLTLQAALAGRPGRSALASTGVALTLFGLGWVGATHDFLAYQRARAATYDALVAEHGRDAVCGGFEFDNHPASEAYRDQSHAPWVIADGRVDAEHEYIESTEVPVDTWLPFGIDSLRVLEARSEGGEQ